MKRIGIDAGGSLIKIAYEENGKLRLKTFPAKQINEVISWLRMIAPEAVLHVTGGRAESIKGNKPVSIFKEFKCVIEGTKYLLMEEKKLLKTDYLLVNIGTGTSFFYKNKRLSGTGVGGGLFTGLGAIIANTSDYHTLVDMAAKGDRTNSDLMVSDIYQFSHSPIEASLTAANFGKDQLDPSVSPEDQLAALTQLIGESLVLLSSLTAKSMETKEIVMIGGALTGNPLLKQVIASFESMFDYNLTFLEKGSHAGAIGALYYAE
ncbi:type II pantothenate kinase [Oceanobacillus sp. J11TS1]|uniref:type II pantothenate kinase n=1 Tax=Oceanobacillus sp. J11TS1 TaxID=2807191 RepID=UPI001B2BACAC|nr:type II pantothenate kinase [Oceanobacillus sp. J11TS1]GIO24511.1 type II pantothenate kinase [Oceanobacillus sp. J11TS1]